MNIRHWTAGLVAISTAIAGALLWCGCDTDSASEGISIAPESIVVKPGQTVTFKASGGYEYSWKLNPNDGSGTLNTSKGESVIYTCMSTNIGSMPKQVIVTSTIAGTSEGGTSNATPYSMEATAEVYWAGGTGGGGSISITPSGTQNIATNGTKTYAVSGGTPPYTWSVGNTALGTLSTSSGASTIYTAKGTGNNTITVADSASHTDSESISQP